MHETDPIPEQLAPNQIRVVTDIVNLRGKLNFYSVKLTLPDGTVKSHPKTTEFPADDAT